MSYRLRVTAAAQKDLERLFEFLAADDLDAAIRASKAIDTNPFFRGLLIPFGAARHVALIEIEANETVTVLAIRHQREENFH